jgi:hypothetical protein
MKKIINTPKGTFEIDLTAEDIAQRQLDEQQAVALKQARDAAATAKAAAEQSAINKLKALGLTDAEVKAFRG